MVVTAKVKFINSLKVPFKRYIKTNGSLKNKRNSLHGSQVTMPHDIDDPSSLRSVLRRRSKYDEQDVVHEHDTSDDKDADDTDIQYYGEYNCEENDKSDNADGFVDWDDLNDPDFIPVNGIRADYQSKNAGTGNTITKSWSDFFIAQQSLKVKSW